MNKRCQAICGARGIRDNVHRSLVILCVIDTHNKCLQISFAWSRNDHLLRTSFEVSPGLICLHAHACGLNDIFHTQLSPRQRLQTFTASLDALDLVAVNDQCVALCLHIVLELAMGGIIFHLILEVLSVCGHVNNSDNIDLRAQKALITDCLEDHSTYTAKTIDANVDSHTGQLTRCEAPTH